MPYPHDDALPRARRRPPDAPEPDQPEEREKRVHMAAGLVGAYRYFREHGQTDVSAHATEPWAFPQVGRNDPCPCGSGKKYKKCCGGAAVN